MTLYFAHSNPIALELAQRLHPLEKHLRDVAHLAADTNVEIYWRA